MANAEKWHGTLRKLHAMLGSDNAPEREVAWQKINELLTKYKKTWNDLLEIIAEVKDAAPVEDEPEIDPTFVPAPLDLIANLLRRYLYLSEAQIIALTLWIAHTFKYRAFGITPRLALVSPVRGCGKTTVLSVAAELACKAVKLDNTTPAVLFRMIDRDRPTVLLDEVDNAELPVNAAMRAVLNSGHRSDGKFTRCLNGELTTFSTFAPFALAAIGALPAPVLHRSVILRMVRAPSGAEPLTRFDPKTMPELARMVFAVYQRTLEWAQTCKLNPDPPMPSNLRNRAADNWRVLLSIADDCSPEWGRAARAAALELSEGIHDEDPGVSLLTDIREIFVGDRMTSADIVARLGDLPEGLWSEWRGPKEDQIPHRLTAGALALMLAAFGIRPKTIWPKGPRGANVKSSKGYHRGQFVTAWASYCDGTPAQPDNVRSLHAA